MIVIYIEQQQFIELEKTLKPEERFVDDELLKIGILNIVLPIGDWRDRIIFKIKNI